MQDYIGDCIEEHGNEAIDLVLKQGGMINPGLYYTYENNKVNYLCHINSFDSCENKYPFVNELMESEILSYLSEKIPNCIDLSETELQIDHQICTLCHKCVWICPVDALKSGIEK